MSCHAPRTIDDRPAWTHPPDAVSAAATCTTTAETPDVGTPPRPVTVTPMVAPVDGLPDDHPTRLAGHVSSRRVGRTCTSRPAREAPVRGLVYPTTVSFQPVEIDCRRARRPALSSGATAVTAAPPSTTRRCHAALGAPDGGTNARVPFPAGSIASRTTVNEVAVDGIGPYPPACNRVVAPAATLPDVAWSTSGVIGT